MLNLVCCLLAELGLAVGPEVVPQEKGLLQAVDPFAEAGVGRKSQVEEGPQVARAVPEVALADLVGVLPAFGDPAGAVGALGQVLPPQAEDQKTWFSLFSTFSTFSTLSLFFHSKRKQKHSNRRLGPQKRLNHSFVTYFEYHCPFLFE